MKSVHDEQNYESSWHISNLKPSQCVNIFSTQTAKNITSFFNYIYIKSINDEQHYESSGLWAPRILSPDRQTDSVHQQKI